MQPGEHIAIAGYNGAGKTTLIKLLMRLYDPTEGTNFYHNKDIKDYCPREYHKRTCVVFQDFQLFGATLAQNVVMDYLSDQETNEKADEDWQCFE